MDGHCVWGNDTHGGKEKFVKEGLSAMALYLNKSESSGIPERIYEAILECESWLKGNWSVSLLTDSANDIWQLKLTPDHGKPRTFDIEKLHHNADGVRHAMRLLSHSL